MRIVRLIIGLLLLVEGASGCFRLPAALAAVQSHIGLAAGQASSAYTAGRIAGEKFGLVFGILVILAGGMLLVASAWRKRPGVVVGESTP